MAKWPQQWDLFRTGRVRVGVFRMRPWEPGFGNTGPVDAYEIVFPRLGVEITYAGSSPLVADPNVVMFYNLHQEYLRTALTPEGDRCEWFAVEGSIAAESAARFDPGVRERPERPFEFEHGPCDARMYLLQRRITEALARGGADVDELRVEEAALALLDRAVESAYRARGVRESRPRVGAAAAAARRELVERARAAMAAGWSEAWTLGDLADEAGCSPYHLARVFRETTGRTVHRHLTELRLRSSLESVAEHKSDLTRVGLDAGFSSHSHFTREFRRLFGVTPSAFRGAVAEGRAAVRGPVSA